MQYSVAIKSNKNKMKKKTSIKLISNTLQLTNLYNLKLLRPLLHAVNKQKK